ncbi:MAG: hypothetical protein GXX96_16225 [Planctomycetaceae bacterium]|nr:hypothetical protein [Planctomycetaceae bacterium]
MDDDPIVASVRKIREELSAAFGFDVHAIFADLRRREAALGDRLVRQPEAQRPNEAGHPGSAMGDLPGNTRATAGG